MSLMKRLWNDEAGFVVSAELILIATIAVLGLIVALDTVRNAITSELSDVAGAIQDVNQSYSYSEVLGHSARVAGSAFADQTDFCDSPDDAPQDDDNCIDHTGVVYDEGVTGPFVVAPNNAAP
ncbi:Flp family type IVb pilin [Bremerella sp. T1]|uniref:Flp family type IVb pilin n=1 Tax=Bremerella sp. TYQ1 TaxID=3119568 RepID=UPI001CCB12DA|nr:hypothetical protein [Bremerella volcania]UBM36139.1 hypothetical protein LA756_26215 [Bremerella volcania]